MKEVKELVEKLVAMNESNGLKADNITYDKNGNATITMMQRLEKAGDIVFELKLIINVRKEKNDKFNEGDASLHGQDIKH